MDVNFITGFIVGAIVMWIFDWFFYGRSDAEDQLTHAHHELAQEKEAHADASANLAKVQSNMEATANDLVQARADSKQCSAALEAAQARIAELEAEAAAEPAPVAKAAVPSSAKDNLKRVNGVGPVYEKKLNAAGIMTFAQLAAADAQAVHDIIQPKEWQAIDTADWVAEAKQFAAE